VRIRSSISSLIPSSPRNWAGTAANTSKKIS